MQNIQDSYSLFKVKQLQLANMIKQCSTIASKLNMHSQAELLKMLEEKVVSDSFKIQVVGTFKNGKSTFINSFLGKEILPAYATPCTAVINEVKYGEKPRAILFFREELPEKLSCEIPEITISYMKRYNMKKIPPIEIPYEQIENYVVIPMGKDPRESLLESPYEKIELYWPLDILKNGVEIIDSPGLNEHETRTRITLDYLKNADAVLFILSALAVCSNEEMKFLEYNLRKQGFEDLFFIVNRFDQLSSDKEKERVKKFSIQKLKEQTTFGEKGIFFTSAQDALIAKCTNDNNKFESSGMALFEETLTDFLLNQRGNVKLSQPARELKYIINEALFKIIPQGKSMLGSKLNDIKSRYEEAKPKLQAMENKKKQMADRLELLTERMMNDFRRCINSYFREMSEKIPVWVDTYEPQSNIKVFHPKESVNEIIQEISCMAKEKIEEYQIDWSKNTLEPLIADKTKDMLLSVESNLQNFFIEVDNIRIDITGKSVSGEAMDIPLWKRALAAGTGFVCGDISSAFTGSMVGFTKGLAKQIAIQFGLYFTLALFGLLNPVTIIAAIGIGFIIGFAGMKKQLTYKIKEKLKPELKKQVEQVGFDSIEKICTGIQVKIAEICKQITGSMENEISAIRTQVEDIINKIKAGQDEVNKCIKEFDTSEENIKKVNTELDDFIFNLIQKETVIERECVNV